MPFLDIASQRSAVTYKYLQNASLGRSDSETMPTVLYIHIEKNDRNPFGMYTTGGYIAHESNLKTGHAQGLTYCSRGHCCRFERQESSSAYFNSLIATNEINKSMQKYRRLGLGVVEIVWVPDIRLRISNLERKYGHASMVLG